MHLCSCAGDNKHERSRAAQDSLDGGRRSAGTEGKAAHERTIGAPRRSDGAGPDEAAALASARSIVGEWPTLQGPIASKPRRCSVGPSNIQSMHA